jgi:hypothetical protein
LRAATRLLSDGALEDPLAVDWSQLRYQHLAVLADEDRKAAGIAHIRDWPQPREADIKETTKTPGARCRLLARTARWRLPMPTLDFLVVFHLRDHPEARYSASSTCATLSWSAAMV